MENNEEFKINISLHVELKINTKNVQCRVLGVRRHIPEFL
jgi:hypothetical protein